MISFHSQVEFKLKSEKDYRRWLNEIARSYGKVLADLSYVFCSDEYLHEINLEYLQHDTLTDIITFDYAEGDLLKGEIYISVDRVKENALEYNVIFDHELKRVIAHGLLHLCGYGDKNEEEKKLMRQLENDAIGMFHVKQ